MENYDEKVEKFLEELIFRIGILYKYGSIIKLKNEISNNDFEKLINILFKGNEKIKFLETIKIYDISKESAYIISLWTAIENLLKEGLEEKLFYMCSHNMIHSKKFPCPDNFH